VANETEKRRAGNAHYRIVVAVVVVLAPLVLRSMATLRSTPQARQVERADLAKSVVATGKVSPLQGRTQVQSQRHRKATRVDAGDK